MVGLPAAIAVSKPAVLIVAIEGILMLHVPPADADM